MNIIKIKTKKGLFHCGTCGCDIFREEKDIRGHDRYRCTNCMKAYAMMVDDDAKIIVEVVDSPKDDQVALSDKELEKLINTPGVKAKFTDNEGNYKELNPQELEDVLKSIKEKFY